MHHTTTFTITEAFEAIQKLNTELSDVDWMPIEQALGLAVAGSLLIERIMELREERFTDDEVEFVNATSDIVEEVLLSLYDSEREIDLDLE